MPATSSFDFRGWLRVLNVEEYADRFQQNGLNAFDKLAALTETDLKRLGILSFLVNRILRAAGRLRSRGKEEASRVLAQDLLVSVQN